MWASASPGLTVRLKACCMPGVPAVPRNRAYSDQPNAARVPMEMRVSMVAAPWRRFVQVARWNGQAPQTTTGAARVRESHCQQVNCSGGIMASRIAGMDSAALISVRRPNAWSSAALACSMGSSAGAGACAEAPEGTCGVAFGPVALWEAGVAPAEPAGASAEAPGAPLEAAWGPLRKAAGSVELPASVVPAGCAPPAPATRACGASIVRAV